MLLLWALFGLVTHLSSNVASVIPDTPNKIPEPASSINESTSDVPSPSSRIINGFFVSETDFTIPWIVALFQWNQAFCTGSLISDQHILTAAHCVASKPKDYKKEEICWRPFQHKRHPFQAVIGETDYNNANYNSNKIHQVIQHWIHDRYKGSSCGNFNFDFDFAILKLQKPVSIKPVCLHSGASKGKKEAYAFGYGATAPHQNQPMSNILKGVKLYVVSRKQCTRQYGWVVPSTQVCLTSGYETDTYFEGTCKGDSGGPLVLHDKSFGFIQVGVTAAGSLDYNFDCSGDAPNIFGRVSKVLSFIKSKAGSIKTC